MDTPWRKAVTKMEGDAAYEALDKIDRLEVFQEYIKCAFSVNRLFNKPEIPLDKVWFQFLSSTRLTGQRSSRRHQVRLPHWIQSFAYASASAFQRNKVKFSISPGLPDPGVHCGPGFAIL